MLVFAGINMSELRNRQQSTIHFINLQKGWPDFSKVPTRQAFTNIADKAFKQLDVAKVGHRVVSQQNHADSETKLLFEKHYHRL